MLLTRHFRAGVTAAAVVAIVLLCSIYGPESVNVNLFGRADRYEQERTQFEWNRLMANVKLKPPGSTSPPTPRPTIRHTLPRSTLTRSTLPRASTTTPTPILLPRKVELTQYTGSTFAVTADSICTDSTYMVILVQSAPQHHNIRMMMRKTWGELHQTQMYGGQQLEQEVRMGFIIGESYEEKPQEDIMAESSIYNDVIVTNFFDSYRNLTLKTLASLQWVDTYCPSAQYFLKCDDDSIVQVPNLLRFLAVNQISRGMVGELSLKHVVERTGRWRVNPEVYPESVYPPYYSGPAYIINTELIKELLNAAMITPMIPIEDAYVTGILARLVNARRFAPGGFADSYFTPPSACALRNPQFYVGTNIAPELLEYLYRSITSDMQC